jgi:hypothetical protein
MKLVRACVVVLLLAGCSTQKSWVYVPNSYPAKTGQKTAVVLPFEDLRNDSNINHISMCLIPLVPFGYVTDHRPELDPVHIPSLAPNSSLLWATFKPTEDLAQGLASELRATGEYKNAYFGFASDHADLVFTAQVLSTDYDETLISYGLSIFGYIPSLLGLPEGTVDNDLALHLQCADRNGRVVFQRTYTADHYHRLFWVYDVANEFNYSEMAQQIYGRFVADLRSSGACAGTAVPSEHGAV